MFWCVNNFYSPEVLQLVEQIASAGSRDTAAVAATQSFRATLTVKAASS